MMLKSRPIWSCPIPQLFHSGKKDSLTISVIRCCFLLGKKRDCHVNANPSERNTNYFCDGKVRVNSRFYPVDSTTNVTTRILDKVGRNLHLDRQHPIGILKDKIHAHFHAAYRARYGGPIFAAVDNLDPVVTTEQNFDSLLVPANHVSRSRNDNYYLNSQNLLRAHTSAHQRDLIKSGWDAFLVTGDVYRRDEIDRSHYPIFHQMEGVRIFSEYELFGELRTEMKLFEERGTRTPEKQEVHTTDASKMMEFNLKYTLTKMVESLFEEEVETRWVDTYFPFTHPSWELELKFGDDWVEMLGCGIMEHGILQKACPIRGRYLHDDQLPFSRTKIVVPNLQAMLSLDQNLRYSVKLTAGASDRMGWAFGLGLERFAMKLYDINDIRLFWSEDPRFLKQFESDKECKYKPFSKYPPTYKDISLWLPKEFSSNDFFDVVRSAAGDIAEEVKLIDEFVHPKSGRASHCYRITYRAMDKTFTDDEINAIQDRVVQEVRTQLNVELR